jgi:twitching motility protein PilT
MSGAFIDRLVQTLEQQKARAATLTPGRPIMIKRAGQQTPLSDRALSDPQLRKMLGEVLSPDQRAAFERDRELTIRRENGVTILASSHQGALRVEVTLPAPEVPVADFSARGGLGEVSAPMLKPSAAPSGAPAPSFGASPTGTTRATGGGRPTHYEIDKYLMVMFEEGCSDLHLTSNNPPLYRKDGDIVHLRDMPEMNAEQVDALLQPLMPERNARQFAENWDSDFAHEIEGVARFRVNVFRDRHGPGGVFRIIPSDIMTAEDLNLSDHIMDLCWLTKGLVLVTGPTGSGKSTTLAALIDYINRKRAAHIITIEDPVEFVHDTKKALINQREVGVHTRGFKPALRAALREDPDIVLVGEMRDLETIEIAIETAETGHLVFGTLHTTTAPSTVDRIIDQFPADRQGQIRTMLSESLRAVIAQTLCKKIGGGRIAALEVLMCNNAMSNLIREGKTFQIPSMMSTGKREGMVTLNDSLMELVKKRIVTPEEAYMKAVFKGTLKSMYERENIRLNL